MEWGKIRPLIFYLCSLKKSPLERYLVTIRRKNNIETVVHCFAGNVREERLAECTFLERT